MFSDDEKMDLSGYDEHARSRIIYITTQIVVARVAKGEVDDGNEEELKAAIKDAAETARAAVSAALEYISG